MAKSVIKTYFSGGDKLNRIVRIDGSAEKSQSYVRDIIKLNYAGLSIPSGKKVLSHTIMLHLNASNDNYEAWENSPTSGQSFYSRSSAAPEGYTVETTTTAPYNVAVYPTPIISTRGFAYMQYTSGHANIVKEYDAGAEIKAGDWVSLELPHDTELTNSGTICLAQMTAYTPTTNPDDNRLPAAGTAYYYTGSATGDWYYYDFRAYWWMNYTDYLLPNRCYLETVVSDYPQQPVINSPIYGETVTPTDGTVRFSWTYTASAQSNLPQKGYNVEISGDGLNWTAISGTSTNQYADIPIASIPSGNFYWRVQTIDTDDAPSDYSEQAYAYYGTAPTAPSITTSVFTTAKPRLEWTTTFTQTAYKVQILHGATYIVDTTVESSDSFYDVPIALVNDEQYTVRVAARNDEAHYSEWAEDTIMASFTVPSAPKFVLSKKKDSVHITIDDAQNVLRYDIYRWSEQEDSGYKRIGNTTAKEYVDWSVPAGSNTYAVKAVNASGESTMNGETIDYKITSAWLTAVDTPNLTFEVRYNVSDNLSGDYEVTMMEYAGRGKPVAEFGLIGQNSVSVSFATNNADEYQTLKKIVERRGTVLYRSPIMKMYGVCVSPTIRPADYYGMIYNLSFVINEVEHSEVV